MRRIFRILILSIIIINFISIFLSIITYGYGFNVSNLNSSEPNGNIILYEVRDITLLGNKASDYVFSSPEFSIYKISIFGKADEYNIPLRIDYLRESSKLVNKSPPGNVYRNENILINSRQISSFSAEFKIKDSWLKNSDFNIMTNNAYLLRWNGSNWDPIKSTRTIDDGIYTYFRVPNIGNSTNNIFSISILRFNSSTADQEFSEGVEVKDTPKDDAMSLKNITSKPNMLALGLGIAALVLAIGIMGIIKTGQDEKKI